MIHEVKLSEIQRYAENRHDILLAGSYGGINKELVLRVERRKTIYAVKKNRRTIFKSGVVGLAVEKYNSIQR
jgi:hypothetical protein